MDIEGESVDSILISAPYSFAIGYAENDAFHLAALGVDRSELDGNMVGLRGGPNLADKFASYLEDMGSLSGASCGLSLASIVAMPEAQKDRGQWSTGCRL